MTPEEKAVRRVAEAYTVLLGGLTDALGALRPALEALARAASPVAAEIEAEEYRRAHPRITDNLGKIHRRYRRPA